MANTLIQNVHLDSPTASDLSFQRENNETYVEEANNKTITSRIQAGQSFVISRKRIHSMFQL